MSSANVVTLWRCAECGRWSHAKRRPISHPRFVRNLDDLLDDHEMPEGRRFRDAAQHAADLELPVVYVREPQWSSDPDAAEDLGGVKIKCGPFVEYRAELVAAWNEDPVAKRHAARLSAESAEEPTPAPAPAFSDAAVPF